jgi:membrane protein implicated in regulation of membrane protease activity
MGVEMTELSIESTVAECARYWRDTGVAADQVTEMSNELTDHLAEATSAGQTVDSVVGADLTSFAEEWASTYRNPVKARIPQRTKDRSGAVWLWLTIGLFAIAFVFVAILAPKGTDVDAEQWRWIWVAAAVILAIGELLTVGFFLLPFAVGAAAAAILAFIGVPVPIQLITFVVISVAFLAVLQRFAKRDEENDDVAQAGGSRYVGREAIVLQVVDRFGTKGMVRVGTEEWRATIDSDIDIPVGAHVNVVEVRGTRLVVVPIPPTVE